MKYELEPDNRNCPDEVLLEDLRLVAKQLGKKSLNRGEYSQYGRFHNSTIRKRFGSWNRASRLAGLDELNHRNTTEELFENMAIVWEHLGRQPKECDFQLPLSSITYDPYVRKFGSWRKALEAFVAAANSGEIAISSEAFDKEANTPRAQPSPELSRRPSPRKPSWRLRYLVMKRDNFVCQKCGASPAKNPAVSLHLDHKFPWSKGGETTFENLLTCCETCNIGKSDLLE